MPNEREVARFANADLFCDDEGPVFNATEGFPVFAGGGVRRDDDQQTIENPPDPPAPCKNLISERPEGK